MCPEYILSVKRSEQCHQNHNWNKNPSACSGFITIYLHSWWFFTVPLFYYQPCIFMAGKQIISLFGGAHILCWWYPRSCSATHRACKTSLTWSTHNTSSGTA